MTMRQFFRNRSRRDRRSRAAAVVEFAVVLPLLLTVLFGIIEYGWIFMVRQTLQTAAREGCRVAVLQSSNEPYSDVLQRIEDVMQPTGLSYTVDMTHAVPDSSNPDDQVETVQVTVSYAEVSLMGDFFGHGDGTLAGRCSMRKEGT